LSYRDQRDQWFPHLRGAYFFQISLLTSNLTPKIIFIYAEIFP
jgi:hypothetical protein